jgi:MYXO-CTERM domain-containing protein
MRHIARHLSVAALLIAVVLLRPAPALADAVVAASPGTVMPGEPTTVAVGCGSDASSATLSGTSFGGPSQIAMAKDTANGPGAFSVTVTIPSTTLPGTYDLSVTCNTGESGLGTLIVASSVGPATGGGSTSTGANQTLLFGGLVLLALAGLLLFRRRSAGR